MNIEIANRLLEYRKKSGLSQEELAEKIGVSRQAVSKWERSEASPDTDNLILLAEVYGVTLDELLRGKDAVNAQSDTSNKNERPDFEPDENTEYVKKERVSFKNGIHVDGKDKVDISFKDGIHVNSHDGSQVHVSKDGVFVRDGEKTRAYTSEDGHIMVDKEAEHIESEREKAFKHFPVWAICLGVFLMWGFSGALCGWALAWVCFLIIPIYYSLVDAIFKKNPNHFAFPVLCVIFQVAVGFLCNGWEWSWLAYITIPIYYGFAAFFHRDKS